MILDKKKLNKLIKKLPKGKIILMCMKDKCPRYSIIDKEDYEPKNAVVMVNLCPWHDDSDSNHAIHYDKNFKPIIW